MTMRLVTNDSECVLLAALHAKCFAEKWSAESMAGLLAQPGTFAVVSDDDAGFILVRAAGGESEILTLAVEPAARRRGIGTALVQAGADEATRHGAASMFLEVGSANFAAFTLYIRLGFAEVGHRKDYYRTAEGGRDDALVLRATLPLCRVGNCD